MSGAGLPSSSRRKLRIRSGVALRGMKDRFGVEEGRSLGTRPFLRLFLRESGATANAAMWRRVSVGIDLGFKKKFNAC